MTWNAQKYSFFIYNSVKLCDTGFWLTTDRITGIAGIYNGMFLGNSHISEEQLNICNNKKQLLQKFNWFQIMGHLENN